MIGQARPAITPGQVRIYYTAPANYDEIAIITASSKHSWTVTDQAKIDKAIERMQIEAASLGANGILIQRTDDEYSGSVGTGGSSLSGNVALGTSVAIPIINKSVEGLAIFVPDNQPPNDDGLDR
ncbi:hypothetical protein [Neptunicella sp. SCSIO 80796]|uniref:hypothetical protein n=1 Tax=Neptunicella plasticusilytica TaxID=3117012 RepID=UPI003A4E39E2